MTTLGLVLAIGGIGLIYFTLQASKGSSYSLRGTGPKNALDPYYIQHPDLDPNPTQPKLYTVP